MPEVLQALLARANTGAGTPTAVWSLSDDADGSNVNETLFRVDVRNSSSMSVFTSVTGGTVDPTFTFEVTADPAGLTGWAAAAVRLPGGGAYAATAIVHPVADRTYFFDPVDNVSWVRINRTAGDRTLNARLTYEV